jgi:hypothetical protein
MYRDISVNDKNYSMSLTQKKLPNDGEILSLF